MERNYKKKKRSDINSYLLQLNSFHMKHKGYIMGFISYENSSALPPNAALDEAEH